jgi:hypothetical protein
MEKGLTGLQLWNGMRIFEKKNRGTSMWVNCLLKGLKSYNYAGNDAHGDFSIARKIKIPFVSGRITTSQLFGNHRTCLYLEKALSEKNVVSALRRGNCIVTDGPFLEMTLLTSSGRRIYPGETISPENVSIEINALSSHEYGHIQKVIVWEGEIGANEERILRTIDCTDKSVYQAKKRFRISERKAARYIRGEMFSARSSGDLGCCLTNPIWIDKFEGTV